jgi:hypothetical protein
VSMTITAEPAAMTEDDLLFDLDVQVVESTHANDVYGMSAVHTSYVTEQTCSECHCSAYTCQHGMAPNMCIIP